VGVKQINQLLLVLRLRMTGPVSPLLKFAFVACMGENLPI